MDEQANEKSESSENKTVSGESQTVSIDDFIKLDLRVACIKEAKPHPKADKLLILKIAVGQEEKQIIAGIKEFYDPESLVGKKIIVINNLKPVRLRGEISEGMLLAAKDERGLRVLVPDGDIESGSKIS